jgi:uncharacterized protein (TIGR03503 family)
MMSANANCVWGVFLAMLILCVQPLKALEISDEKADLRILIDVSGSMKKNDPMNLRRPALRLLVGLLPPETRAGVWTFGQYVNMLIPLGQVDKAWKHKARKIARSIGSPGQYTNIEDALKRATQDWNTAPGPYRRSIILLTDGMVDISKNSAENRASKERILKQTLSRLKKQKVTIHTIALSKNADHELMRELATSSGGWYEQTQSADQLQKVFLRIFEKVGKPDAIPLQDNKFTVDASITEATLLVFHKPNAKPTQVVPPNGDPFSSKNAPKTVTWHRDEGYDMLTIEAPRVGEWLIRAEVDPDNRVMVVTDLKMHTTDLPNQVVQGQILPYEVSFSDHGNIIRKQAFLQVVNVAGTTYDNAGASESHPLLDDGRGSDQMLGDGLFSMDYGGEWLHRGLSELVISARGPTFTRERRITYEVVPPFHLELTPWEEGQGLDLKITADDQLIDPSEYKLQAWLEDERGQQSVLELLSVGPVSAAKVNLMDFSGIRKIALKALAKTRQGDQIEYYDRPVEIEGVKPLAPVSEPVAPAVQEPQNIVPPEPEPELEQKEAVQEAAGWVGAIIWFGVINLLLILLIGGGIWWFRGSSQNNKITLMDSNEAESSSMEQENAS